MNNEFLKRTFILASVFGSNLVLALSNPVFALGNNLKNSPNDFSKIKLTEAVFNTFSFIMIVVAIIYWYKSTKIIKKHSEISIGNQHINQILESHNLK